MWLCLLVLCSKADGAMWTDLRIDCTGVSVLLPTSPLYYFKVRLMDEKDCDLQPSRHNEGQNVSECTGIIDSNVNELWHSRRKTGIGENTFYEGPKYEYYFSLNCAYAISSVPVLCECDSLVKYLLLTYILYFYSYYMSHVPVTW